MTENKKLAHPKIPGVGFFVNDRPYAVWEWDLAERNYEFIDGINGEYFNYVASVHQPNLAGEHKQLAALSIRAAYHHGLETFLTLMCAAVQAPHCMPAWIPKCKTADLRTIVSAITKGHFTQHNNHGVSLASWEEIAATFLPLKDFDEGKRVEVQDGFAGVWHRFSYDWLEQSSVDEYNGFKHGLRARPGGMMIKVGIEHEVGVSPPEEEMKVISSCEYGSSYFRAEPVRGAPDQNGTHFRIKRHHVSWIPDAMADRLSFISLSIENLKSFLKLKNSKKPFTAEFWFPENNDDYWAPWSKTPGVTSSTMDLDVHEVNIERLNPEEIRKRLLSKKEA